MEQNNRNRRQQYVENQITDNLGKLPPRDIELEEAVLGAVMLEADAFMNVCDILTPDSFYEPKNKKIFEAIVSLGTKQIPIDMLTVTEELRRLGLLEEVGGPLHITELTSRVYSAANVEFHARIVAQKYLSRRLISYATNVEKSAFDESLDVDEVLQSAESDLFSISQSQLKRDVTQIDPVVRTALEQIQLASNRETGLSGLSSGFEEIDKITAGWQNSDLIIIAARPAMGKTAFMLSMAKNMAIDMSIPTAVFTLEMSNVQLMKRVLSNAADLENDKIKTGRLSAQEWDRINTRTRAIYGAPLYLDETPGLGILELRTKARRLVREKGVKIIMIDYLQLMTASVGKGANREIEVSTISRSLKALAKELNIPIVALAQVSRLAAQRDDKRPMLSDLRESGAIEQDADLVCFIHRPSYYTKSTEDAEGNDIRDLSEFIIAKHRNGSTETIKLRFVSRYVRFEDWNKSFDTVRESVDNPTAEATTPTMRIESRWNAPADPLPTDIDISSGPEDAPIPF